MHHVAKKELGQYFTPPEIARFMASLSSVRSRSLRILDAGAGDGILSISLVGQLAAERGIKAIHVVAFEVDEALIAELKRNLRRLKDNAPRRVQLSWEVRCQDFLEWHPEAEESFDIAIINPPYFKLRKADSRLNGLLELCHGQPNIYALFMAQCAKSLRDGGELISITPRSFASGEYFRSFRSFFFSRMKPTYLHEFVSRSKAFESYGILQESLIMRSEKRRALNGLLAVSVGDNPAIAESGAVLICKVRDVLDYSSDVPLMCVPRNKEDLRVLKDIHKYDHNLKSAGLSVSTGKVVAFRAEDYLLSKATKKSCPLLWMNNVQRGTVTWPLEQGKSEHFDSTAAPQSLLIPRRNYVLVRRFSTKDDRYRVIATPLFASDFQHPYLAIENHLNVISSEAGLTAKQAKQLAEYLNSELVENYFRIMSGNTQIGAAELLSLPCPSILSASEIAA